MTINHELQANYTTYNFFGNPVTYPLYVWRTHIAKEFDAI